MKKWYIIFLASFSTFIWLCLASSILNPSYSVNWDDVKIYRTNNSKWWYMDINLKDPETNDRLHFWEVKMSDQEFTYTKQWDWKQEIQLLPWDWWDPIEFTISSNNSSAKVNNKTSEEEHTVTRTVIPAVPKTGPSGSIIWIILATLAIFGWYIYIRKRANI